MGGRVQPGATEVGADERIVLLLDEAIVVLVEGPAATQLHVHDGFPPVAHQMMIEELAAVVRMQVLDREGQARQDRDKVCLHRPLSASQDRHPLAPTRRDVHHL